MAFGDFLLAQVVHFIGIFFSRDVKINYSENGISLTGPKKRNVCWLTRQKSQVTIYFILPLDFSDDLEPNPSTKNYAKYYPTLYKVKEWESLGTAYQLIINAYNMDFS